MKYWAVFKIAWKNGFVYQFSVFLWRFRNVISSIMALSVWSILYTGKSSILFGYDKNQMISYIFLTAVIQSLVLSSALNGLANLIYSGQISHELIKPINIYLYLATQEITDKLKNFLFAIIEIIILFYLFQPNIGLPQFDVLVQLGIFLLGGLILNFLVSLLFGAIGFWSPDTWGPRFLFFMFTDFAGGKLFPLDILPALVQRAFYLTPFPYFSFIPTQIFLGRFSTSMISWSLLGMFFWIIVSLLLVKVLWKIGWKQYQSAGQ